MSFPVYIHLGGWAIHPHLLFETLAYFIGFRVYLYTRQKGRIPMYRAIWIVIGAMIGAAVGSKLLYWLEDPMKTWQHLTEFTYLMAGKNIVGGLLGGLIGVETAKKVIGWISSTGDDFVIPLIIGMSIGRIGCFLTGLSDHTHGTPTSWVTGIDFGDGILRHPTQLYEIAFLLLLGLFSLWIRRKGIFPWEGFLFQIFMMSYLSFRLGMDFLKPTPHPYWIFNNIQIAALFGLCYYVSLWLRKKKERLSYAQ